jgi:hypothetical protein
MRVLRQFCLAFCAFYGLMLAGGNSAVAMPLNGLNQTSAIIHNGTVNAFSHRLETNDGSSLIEKAYYYRRYYRRYYYHRPIYRHYYHRRYYGYGYYHPYRYYRPYRYYHPFYW